MIPVPTLAEALRYGYAALADALGPDLVVTYAEYARSMDGRTPHVILADTAAEVRRYRALASES